MKYDNRQDHISERKRKRSLEMDRSLDKDSDESQNKSADNSSRRKQQETKIVKKCKGITRKEIPESFPDYVLKSGEATMKNWGDQNI